MATATPDNPDRPEWKSARALLRKPLVNPSPYVCDCCHLPIKGSGKDGKHAVYWESEAPLVLDVIHAKCESKWKEQVEASRG